MSAMDQPRPEPHLPAELTERDQWVLWRYEARNGRQTKIPVTRTGSPASSTDPSTWCGYADAVDAWRANRRKFAGIGYVFTETDPHAGIDLDNCIGLDGVLKPWARPTVEKLADSYMEVSPSGRGIKIFVRATLPGNGTKRPYQDGAIEIYGRGRFFTVTGNVFNGAPLQVEDHQRDVENLLQMLTGGGPAEPKADIPSKDAVLEGGRHEYLTSIAAQFGARGMAPAEIFAATQALNLSRCKPPKQEAEVRAICEWVANKERGKPARLLQMAIPVQITSGGAPELLSQHFGDYGNAQRLVTLHGEDLRYCYAFEKWLVWDGRRWAVDDGELARQRSQATILEFARQALAATNDAACKFAASCLNSQRISNALREAQPHLAIKPNQLDIHPDLLNFENGTLDLKTGELRGHQRENFITKIVRHPYRAAAECPVFLGFLDQITANRSGLVAYLQRAFGYSLTGHTIEKAVFFLHGRGDNGKSTLLSTFLKLLEEYAVLLQIDTLMVRQESNNSQADLADLRGARFVMTSETEEGQRLAEGKLKRITQGMGRIKATRKYENPVEFPESHKLWIDANHLPVIRGTDNAIWNRLHPVPFDVVFAKNDQDKELPVKLLAEDEGILAWVVAGAGKWYTAGLGKPSDVEQVGRDWRSKSGQIGRFVQEKCITAGCVQARADQLYQAYRHWAEAGNEKPIVSANEFGIRVEGLGFQRKHQKNGNWYLGIGIRAEEPDPEVKG